MTNMHRFTHRLAAAAAAMVLTGAPLCAAMKSGDKQIAVYNVEGEIYATDNICTHAFALLTDGFLDGDIIECPLHGGCFNVKTGEGQGAPISEDIKTYPVRVNGDTIEVNVG